MMEDLLKAMMEGAAPEKGSGEGRRDPLMDLLGGILSGGGAGQAGSQGAAGGLADLLGMLGGAGSGGGTGSLFEPILSRLAEQLGLSPQLAQMVVSFVLGKLLTGAATGSGASGRAAVAGASTSFDLDQLLGQMQGGQGVETRFLDPSGMAAELAEQTGMDHELAAASLQEVFGMLGAQLGDTPGATRGRP
jgi:hypothetical protein